MKVRSKRLKAAVLLGLAVFCAGGVGVPAVMADTVNVVTQDDYTQYNNANPNATYCILPINSTTGASNNTVTIGQVGGGTAPVLNAGTTYGTTIYGGDDSNATATNSTNNTVTINSGSNIGNIRGGYSANGSVSNNTVTVNGGSVIQTTGNSVVLADGGYTENDNTDNKSNVNNNTITVNGGTLDWVEGGDSNGISSGNVYQNAVVINGGTMGPVDGGYTNGSGSVYQNTVTITGGTLQQGACGGNSEGSKTSGVTSGAVTNNTVTIMGGTISGNIIGGLGTGVVTNNTVTINPVNTLDISAATLYGSSDGKETPTYDRANGNQLGNTLNVYGKGITAKNVVNFSNINFYLPSNIQNKDTALTLTDTAGTDVSYSTVKAGVTGNAKLSKGDTVYLLTNKNGLTTTGTSYGKLTEGVSLNYDLDVHQDGNSIVATIDKVDNSDNNGGSTNGGGNSGGNGGHSTNGLNYQTKSLVETRAASMGFLNNGMDLASNTGMDNAISLAEGTFVPFVAMAGDAMRYHTGSYVDVRGYNTMLGFSRKYAKKDGAFYLAPFVEAGWGRYTSHLDDITADGSTNYYGLGVLLRRQHDSGFYYEGSLHYGRMRSTYNSSDLKGAASEYYDLTTPYYSVYAGLGKEHKLNGRDSTDVYGKYFYTRQNGDTTDLSSGETYNFDNMTSNRVQIGMRFTRKFDDRHKMYVGAAYQYEFSGSADADYKGYTTPESSLKGSSGMLEIGYELLSSKDKPTALDIGITGWTGKQNGIIPNATVKWYF